MKNYLNRIGINAVKAGLKIINKEKKNKILKDYVSLLTKYNDKILKENLKDLKIARQKKLDINLAKKYGWKSKMNFDETLEMTIEDFKRKYC